MRSLLLSALFAISAFSATTQPADAPATQPATQAARLKVACLGDSITYGAKIDDRQAFSYPAQLQQLLGDRYDVQNFGIGGVTLLKKGNRPYWEQRRLSAAADFQPDIVVIMLGTNDSKPMNWSHKDDFAANYKELIQRFADLPTHPKIWLCHPVPAFKGDHDIRDEVIRTEIIPLVDAVAKEMNLKTIDCYTPLVGKQQFFPDTIHPNADGARVIAQTVHKALRPADE